MIYFLFPFFSCVRISIIRSLSLKKDIECFLSGLVISVQRSPFHVSMMLVPLLKERNWNICELTYATPGIFEAEAELTTLVCRI